MTATLSAGRPAAMLAATVLLPEPVPPAIPTSIGGCVFAAIAGVVQDEIKIEKSKELVGQQSGFLIELLKIRLVVIMPEDGLVIVTRFGSPNCSHLTHSHAVTPAASREC